MSNSPFIAAGPLDRAVENSLKKATVELRSWVQIPLPALISRALAITIKLMRAKSSK
ncbi:MAG: hypothetical protein M3239_00785 [Thermoproteota archaeon]|nr:hypothetical protein [Thermoproteota archaeon]